MEELAYKANETLGIELDILVATHLFRVTGEKIQKYARTKFPLGCVVESCDGQHEVGIVTSHCYPYDQLCVLLESRNEWLRRFDALRKLPMERWPRWVRDYKLSKLPRQRK